MCSDLSFFLVMWQWAHLRFCSLCSCVLHIFVSLVVLSLILAYALVLCLVVFHGLQGLHRGICTCRLHLSLPRFQPWENHAWWWSRFKEPPVLSFLVAKVQKEWVLLGMSRENKQKIRTTVVGSFREKIIPLLWAVSTISLCHLPRRTSVKLFFFFFLEMPCSFKSYGLPIGGSCRWARVVTYITPGAGFPGAWQQAPPTAWSLNGVHHQGLRGEMLIYAHLLL